MLRNGWSSLTRMETERHSFQFLGPDKSVLTLPDAHEIGAVAAFSTRRGGVSPPPFDSLNLSTQEGDTPANVRKNFQALGDLLDIDPSRIAFCRQVHGDTIHIVESVPDCLPDGDALITTKRGLFLGIKTADCVPILILDPERGITAAVHAGWRGTVLRIAGRVVNTMKDRFGARPRHMLALVGPAIGPCCYEVDNVVLDPFRESFDNAESFISGPGSSDVSKQCAGESYKHIPEEEKNSAAIGFGDNRGSSQDLDQAPRMLNLIEANRFDLISQGVKPENVLNGGHCTSCAHNLFFSYRRDGGLTGRHVAVAGLR